MRKQYTLFAGVNGACKVKCYNRMLLRRKLEGIQKMEINQLMDETIVQNKEALSELAK